MKKSTLALLILLSAVVTQAQQRDRLGELDVVCRNEWVTHTSVPPDGTLWMATECGEIYRADDIHSPWCILKEGTQPPRYTLQSGDLLFLNNNRSNMEKAITASTGEYSHVALVERDSADDVWVIEASPKNGVQRIPYSLFERNHQLRFGRTIDIYRLTAPFDTAAVIARAKRLVGKPYDNAFLPDNGAYYCSEFIQEAFGGIFPSKPMNWRDADGNLPEYWIKHFEELGVPVPEGVPGTNPTDMSRSPLLRKL